jgi:hypothetical protein
MNTTIGQRVLAAGMLAATVTVNAAHAQTVLPTHYDMLNGYGQANGGGRNYWDASYNGAGNPLLDYSPLSGGLGDLADGVIATQRWDEVENDAGTGPYVGWNRGEPWVITFHFAQETSFSQVRVWHDDANGWGDISPPAWLRVTVGGQTFQLDVVDPPGDAPFASLIDLGPGFTGSVLTLEVLRFNNGVMLSEVQFQATPVPEPAAWLLMAGGAALVLGRRFRA